MNSFNDAQQEQLKEVGAYLRQVRLEKGLRIEQITAKTLIRQVLLEALEEGRYEDLPEPVFVQGFIKRYGDALGLNGTDLAKNFAINFFLLDSENENLEPKQKLNIKSIHIPLAVPYAILLAVASLVLFFKLSPRNSAESVARNQNKFSAAIEKPGSSLQSGASPSSQAFPVEVTIELQDHSWLRVKADGKTAFEGRLNKGERKTWTANKQLTILSENAGAVLVSANKKERKPLGNSGRVKQVTFTPESVNSQ
ncbi:helix-turn-helix domain-containing protein [Chlorogloeopsis sp. ULAP02]|uniref:helix-turn-helix domain-containing protein n=1 Tax=Chlorogloeopsis sp. ULAP02 TaxID=3107926 RepID=UPI003136885C